MSFLIRDESACSRLAVSSASSGRGGIFRSSSSTTRAYSLSVSTSVVVTDPDKRLLTSEAWILVLEKRLLGALEGFGSPSPSSANGFSARAALPLDPERAQTAAARAAMREKMIQIQ